MEQSLLRSAVVSCNEIELFNALLNTWLKLGHLDLAITVHGKLEVRERIIEYRTFSFAVHA